MMFGVETLYIRLLIESWRTEMDALTGLPLSAGADSLYPYFATYLTRPGGVGGDLRVVPCLVKIGTEMAVLYVHAPLNYAHLFLYRCPR